MSKEIIQINSISQLHALSGFKKPNHPLISIINTADIEVLEEQIGLRSSIDLYTIGLKDKGCGSQYGRNSYDFDEGVLFFIGPNQVQTITKAQKKNDVKGWIIVFHPDLIRNTKLGETIDSYNFFSYDIHEALHLSEDEQSTLEDCLGIIRNEIEERSDNHSQTVISSSLELLLNLSKRFYERQFNTRAANNSDLASQFSNYLKAYYQSGGFKEHGSPMIEYFANKMCLSSSYLSDLLQKETGQNAKDQINNFVIEKAKDLLLGSTDSISGIAYELGFNYPHYFSRLFKSKTGKTPMEYRQLN